MSKNPELPWLGDVADHDYDAAVNYLSLRLDVKHATVITGALKDAPVISRRANDILRATQLQPLPLTDPGVKNDLRKVLAGEKLSPVLVARLHDGQSDIADGYHRVSLAYEIDPFMPVPLKVS